MKLKALTVCGAGAVLLVGGGIARADNVAMRPYVAQSLNYVFADKGRESDDGIGGYLGGGFPLSEHFNVELGGLYYHFNHDKSKAGSEPWKEWQQQISAQFFFSRAPAFAPYFGVTVGHTKEILKNSGTDSAFFSEADLGAIHYFKIFDADFGVRASAGYRFMNPDDGKFPGKNVGKFGEPIITLGLLIPVGGGSTPTKEEPIATPIATPVAPSKAPSAVDANRRFDDIHFAFDQSTLDSYARSSLDSDAVVINQLETKYPTLKVDVAGHTDWIGTDAYNQALSERRANAVQSYLTAKGVKPSSIQIHAYGESKPVAPNTTKAGRALNRRVELKTLP
ncbi:MAG: OmpA family protein [Nevskia sp.]|nr:OmpA family protein [Nevskia sp.]